MGFFHGIFRGEGVRKVGHPHLPRPGRTGDVGLPRCAEALWPGDGWRDWRMPGWLGCPARKMVLAPPTMVVVYFMENPHLQIWMIFRGTPIFQNLQWDL